jgi:hypothetical protein
MEGAVKEKLGFNELNKEFSSVHIDFQIEYIFEA